MGHMQEGKLLFSMGTPLALSMLLTALYNIVDSFFVAQMKGVGDEAVTALTLAFPIQMMLTSLAVGTGVGLGAVLSRFLGAGEEDKANRTAGNAMLLYACYFGLACLFGLFAVPAYLRGQTSDPKVLAFGTTYLQIITCCSFAMMCEKCFEKLLQATGKTAYSMFGQLTGSVLNMILDPFFIFGWCGLPALGVKGAAIATIIGQCCAVIVSANLHFRRNKEVRIRLQDLRPDFEILGRILKIGAPAILIQSLTSVMTYGMNLILKGVSTAAVTAYGIYFKLQNFILMPAYGLNNAAVPIVGYNYGARQFTRIKQSIRYGLAGISAIMLFGLLLFQLAAAPIVSVFNLSPSVTQISINALKIISFGFIFAGVNILLQGVCQALGSGLISLFITLIRLVLIPLPVAAVFAGLSGAERWIWLVFPLAELLGCALIIPLTIRRYRLVQAKATLPKDDAKAHA